MNSKTKFIIAVLIFSTLGLFVKQLALPAGLIVLCRGGIGTLFLLFVFLAAKKKFSLKIIKANLWLLLASGLVLGADWIFLFEAYKHTSVSLTTVLYYLEPAFLVTLSALVFKEKLSRLKIFCIGLSLIGLIMVTGLLSGGNLAQISIAGIIFGIAAALAYTGLTFLNKFIKGLVPLESTMIQLAIGTVVVLPYALITADLPTLTIHTADIAILLLLGVVHTGIAFWLYFDSVAKLPSQTIAVLGYTEPIVTIILSAVILHERLDLLQMMGAILVLGSMLISQIQTAGKTPLLTAKIKEA